MINGYPFCDSFGSSDAIFCTAWTFPSWVYKSHAAVDSFFQSVWEEIEPEIQ